jgi:hypothetical protein
MYHHTRFLHLDSWTLGYTAQYAIMLQTVRSEHTIRDVAQHSCQYSISSWGVDRKIIALLSF